MVQSVLGTIDDDSLEVFVVWIPAIRTDSYEASLDARQLISDPRAKHYWDGSQAFGEAMAWAAGTRMRMAWDVYFTFDKDATWEDAPPQPSDWLHQKASEDPTRILKGDKLEQMLRNILSK